MTYCDAHIHLADSKLPAYKENCYICISSCHSKEDLNFNPPYAKHSYGIHPQVITQSYIKEKLSEEISFIENLIKSKKIIAIGECGLDLFTEDFKSNYEYQEIVFKRQIELAEKYSLPIILHLRKSMEKLFTFHKELKKLPSVIFHSFPGTLSEANFLMKKGINCYFSFGKTIINGKKSAIECIKKLPDNTLLLETDAPYQTLKGEIETLPEDIELVYKKAAELRMVKTENLSIKIQMNFKNAFCIS